MKEVIEDNDKKLKVSYMLMIVLLTVSIIINVLYFAINKSVSSQPNDNPFNPNINVSVKALLENNFKQAEVDMPMLTKKVENVEMTYALYYFTENRLKDLVHSGKTIKDITLSDLFNNGIHYYVVEIDLGSTFDSLHVQNLLNVYNVEIDSNILHYKIDDDDFKRFYIINKENFKVFRAIVEQDTNKEYTLRAFYGYN